MNRASPATGWVRNPTMKVPDLDPHLASSYELGWTYNPFTGCLNRTPDGLCLGGMFPCYAFTLANGRLKKRYLANLNVAPMSYTQQCIKGVRQEDPFYPRFWMDGVVRADQMLKASKKPLGIFPCDMSDWCGIGIPESWSDWVLELARRYPQHRFYLLTKQPQNLAKFSPFPENCWVGVTATNQDMYDGAVYHLNQIEATIKYISIEPFLSRIHVPNYKDVDWLILGSQTKPYLAPQSELIGEIVSAADHAGIPVFLKDNLYMITKRQEMPK